MTFNLEIGKKITFYYGARKVTARVVGKTKGFGTDKRVPLREEGLVTAYYHVDRMKSDPPIEEEKIVEPEQVSSQVTDQIAYLMKSTGESAQELAEYSSDELDRIERLHRQYDKYGSCHYCGMPANGGKGFFGEPTCREC